MFICTYAARKRADILQLQLEKYIEEESLDSCPMCGKAVTINMVNSRFSIKCNNIYCNLQTGFYNSKTELVKRWNSINKNNS